MKANEFVYYTFTNGTSNIKMTITHTPTGISVNNDNINIKSLYKLREYLKTKLINKIINKYENIKN